MTRVRGQLDAGPDAFGIKVRDARQSSKNSQAVYQRMQTEWRREAVELRTQGSERCRGICARGDHELSLRNVASRCAVR
jgi:hypothetical protein